MFYLQYIYSVLPILCYCVSAVAKGGGGGGGGKDGDKPSPAALDIRVGKIVEVKKVILL